MQNTEVPAPKKNHTPWIVLVLIIVVAIVLVIKSEDKPLPEPPEEAKKRAMEQIDKFRLALDDNAPVIGVSTNGVRKAFPIQLMMRPDTLVVNDMFGDQPVTVTYYEFDKCVRVFTDPKSTTKLDVFAGGTNPTRMSKLLLKVNGKLYWQDTGEPLEEKNKEPFPFKTIEYTLTTWGEWRQLHPDTIRFLGHGQFRPNETN